MLSKLASTPCGQKLANYNLLFNYLFLTRKTYTMCFTDNRTYHFQAEDENEQRAWTSVLVNCKEGALMRAFHQQAGESNDSGHSLLDLQRSIIRAVRSMPGNQVCADCGSTNGEKSYKTRDLPSNICLNF